MQDATKYVVFTAGRTDTVSRLLLAFSLAWALSSSPCFAMLPKDLEPDYADAVLAMNGKDFDRALKILNLISQKAPGEVEVLELMALAYRSSKQDPKAAQTYLELIETQKNQPNSAKIIAPYEFELGMLFFKEKNYTQARTYFLKSKKAEFNVGASSFFLGNIAVQGAQWNDAESQFLDVLDSTADDLKLPARFYLGQVYLSAGYMPGASRNFLEARKEGVKVRSNPKAPEAQKKAADQIVQAANKSLVPFQKGQSLNSLALITGFDSNVLSLPVGSMDALATGASSIKATLMASFGYMSAPASIFQITPSLRLITNYNSNSAAATGEFITAVGSLYFTGSPLSRFSYGLKVEGMALLQNQTDTSAEDSSRFDFGMYSTSYSVGPYFKFEIRPRLILGLEGFYSPQNVKTDADEAEELARSGNQIQAKSFLQWDRATPLFNPTLAGSYTLNQTAGTEYNSSTIGASFSNLMYFIPKTRLTFAADVAIANYPDRRDGARNDTTLGAGLSFTRPVIKKVTLLGDIKYSQNISNEDELYSYAKISTSLGLSWSF